MGEERFQPAESGEFERETIRTPAPEADAEKPAFTHYDAQHAKAMLAQLQVLQNDADALEHEAADVRSKAAEFKALEGPATAKVLEEDAERLMKQSAEKRKVIATLNEQLRQMDELRNPFDTAA